MPPNNENGSEHDLRRNHCTVEDNPFIAFRHFADSTVAALVDGIAGLPGLLAELNNVNLAREQCLYGKANTEECEKLKAVEDKMTSMHDNEFGTGRASFDHRKLEENVAKYMKLEASARELRTRIVETGRGSEGSSDELSRQAQSDLVERIGNQKGQQWGWSWDWGFPRPFDSEPGKEQHQRWPVHCRRWHNRATREHSSEALPHQELAQLADGIVDAVNQGIAAELYSIMRKTRHTEETHEDVPQPGHSFGPPGPRPLESLPREQYSPYALENNSELKGGAWRDAFEDLLRAERGVGLIPPRLLGQSRQLTYDDWAHRFRDTPYKTYLQNSHHMQGDGNDESELSYEYSHDHEDQHDDPPTPRPNQKRWTGKAPETELEAYERLLGPTTTEKNTAITNPPSILATLTTTERTVAPDGTITTKVVLKKRFSDGKEESSETVHTHRGDGPPRDLLKTFEDRDQPSQENPANPKKGWFWSN